MSRAKVLAAVLAVVGLTTVAGAVADGWSVTILKSDAEWPRVFANDINDSGRIAGVWQLDTAPFTGQAIVWANGSAEPVELDGIEGFDGSWATSINNRGQVGGSVGTLLPKAVIWDSRGKPTSVHPDPNADFSEIEALNDHGDACGAFAVVGWFPSRAYRWWANGTSEVLPKSDPTVRSARASGINKSGVVAGTETTGSTVRAVRWDEAGAITIVHDDLVAANGDIANSLAFDVSDKGEVMGLALNGGPRTWTASWAWIWTEDGGVVFLDQDGTDHATARKSRGRYFAGTVNGNGIFPDTAEAAIWVRGTAKGATVYTLDVLPTPDGYGKAQAYAVSTSGTAVGIATDADGNTRSWIASPHATGNKNK
jgi:uncharacterized membrane protein